MWRLLGASWGGNFIDFSFRKRGQEGLGASRRACRRAFLRLRFWKRPRGSKKCEICCLFLRFLVVFLDVVALVFCLPRRSPARRRKLKN